MAEQPSALDTAFAALAKFDWGNDAKVLQPIDAAVVACHGNAGQRTDLENRFTQLLSQPISRAAVEYICRKLCLIGTAACVPTLAPLLGQPEHSHMARYALERIAAPAAGDALGKALGTVPDELKIGTIASLAARRDGQSVPAIAEVLAAASKAGQTRLAVAAADALGQIQTAAAVDALTAATPTDAAVAAAVVNARLAAAEGLLAAKQPAKARAIYQSLVSAAAGQPRAKSIELAATRGLLACAELTAAS